MKASDLRIGNLVTLNDKSMWKNLIGAALIVSGIEERNEPLFPDSSFVVAFKGSKKVMPFSQFSEFISPIPITEEWLIKAGFSKSEYLKNEFTIVRPSGWIMTICRYGDEWDFQTGDIQQSTFKYIHQLQNLFHALTGEELTFDL